MPRACFLAPLIITLVLVNLVIRFRRSVGVERQQIKWFLAVASVAAIAIVVRSSPSPDRSRTRAGSSGWSRSAACRWRWASRSCATAYEIDRVVSRTISYAVVTAVLVLVFGAFNLVLEAALATLTQASTLAVAGSTLVVFALFQPLGGVSRRRFDRRFDRERVPG